MAKRRWKYLPAEMRSEVIAMAARGEPAVVISMNVGVVRAVVERAIKPLGGIMVPAAVWSPPPGQLTAEERVEIRLGLDRGWALNRIAKDLGRPGSTVSREVNKNGGRAGYRPVAAHQAARANQARPKPSKLAADSVLGALVTEKLEQWWSPEQIARWLRRSFPDRPELWVSHETIYQTLYVQGRGELRRELTACLRTGRAVRKARGQVAVVRGIPNKVMIADRPAEVDDRTVPGHWEGDLIIGQNGKSAVGTLVERTSRFVMFLHLPHGHTAEAVRLAMVDALMGLPARLRRSVTWDQGRELAQHERFTIDTGIAVYFCDPHSPWQRGTNENTNGLARQYMPKSTDLSVHTPADLERFAHSLNTRPRKTLGDMTPLEKLTELIASTP